MDGICPNCGAAEFGYAEGGVSLCMSCYYTEE